MGKHLVLASCITSIQIITPSSFQSLFHKPLEFISYWLCSLSLDATVDSIVIKSLESHLETSFLSCNGINLWCSFCACVFACEECIMWFPSGFPLDKTTEVWICLVMQPHAKFWVVSMWVSGWFRFSSELSIWITQMGVKFPLNVSLPLSLPLFLSLTL